MKWFCSCIPLGEDDFPSEMEKEEGSVWSLTYDRMKFYGNW